jgi:BioD-like phosphotransacetylase family protein
MAKLAGDTPAAGTSLATAVQAVVDGASANASQVIDAAKAAGDGKDVLIVEGGSSVSQGISVGLASWELANALDARVIVVAKYDGDAVVDELTGAGIALAGRLLGAVITGVPANQLDNADRLGRFLGSKGVPLLGVIPFDQRLASTTVGDLAAHLGGEIMNSQEKADTVVENYLVGTVVLGKATDYFRRVNAKAVIAHGTRPDMHLAALESDTRCIVLAGNVIPNPIVLARAEEEDVPLIMVKQDTLAVLEQIEELFPSARFGQVSKAPVMADLLAQHVDLSAIRTPAGAAS